MIGPMIAVGNVQRLMIVESPTAPIDDEMLEGENLCSLMLFRSFVKKSSNSS